MTRAEWGSLDWDETKDYMIRNNLNYIVLAIGGMIFMYGFEKPDIPNPQYVNLDGIHRYSTFYTPKVFIQILRMEKITLVKHGNQLT